jgi:dephospho-CoA kinase
MEEEKVNIIIGITGGIGAGKSLVCKIFEVLGIPVFNADDSAKSIVETDEILKKKIIELLGNEAYAGEKYNRKYVASKVFNDAELLKKLNDLIHPKVRESAVNWFSSQKNAEYYLYEAALMNGAGDNNTLKKVIVVNSPIQTRIERIKKRDGRSEIEIQAIINKQISDEKRSKIADFTIENDEKHSLIEQVLKIHKQLLNL